MIDNFTIDEELRHNINNLNFSNGINILIGKNGSGKSFALSKMASLFSRNKNTLAISNTSFDKFEHKKRSKYHYVGLNNGR